MLGDPASPLLWSINGDQPDERSLAIWCAYTGQSKEAALDWGWLNALHPNDRQNVRKLWKEAILTQRPITFSCQIRHFRQGYLLFKIMNIPLFNAERQIEGWFIFFTEKPANPPQIDENWEVRLMYGMIFTQTVLGIFCLSLDGTILRVNDRFCQLTGYTEAELLTMTLWQLHRPEDMQFHLQAIRERLASEHSAQPFRTRYLRKDGTPTWVRVTQFLVRKPGGEPYFFFFTLEDVNDQVRAEAEHTELIARFQEAHIEALGRTLQLEAVFEAITDGILVSDGNGMIIQSNAAARRILHLDKHSEFLQQPLQQRLTQVKAINENGQALPLEQWPLARVLRGEMLHEGRAGDVQLFLPDGETIYVNHTGACMRDENNQIVGGVVVIHDVNERHILENRIQKSFRILLALAEELVDLPERALQPVTTRQLDNQSQPVHPFQAASEYLAELTCQMLEYRGVSIALLDPETELMRLVALSGFSAEERAFYYDTFSSTIASDYLKESTIARLRENEVVIEEFNYHPDDPRPYKVLLAPMIIDSRLVGVLYLEKAEQSAPYNTEEFSLVKAIAKLILLVIERERIQREWIEAHSSELALREANRRFDEFLSIASHELRTPLAGIKGNIQLALRRLAALKSDQAPALDQLFEKLNKVQDYLLQAEHRVNVQNRMISDLLDVSRIQANKLELVLGPCDLLQVVCDAVKDQQYNVPERVIAFNRPDEHPITVVGDADRLGQVVHNYLTNALKYSPPDRPIAVSIEKKVCEVRVSVQDQGPGLTAEEQKHVWERFYRVKGIPALGGGQGLGLGLHICRTIIEAHQGKFGLESTPGEGSTFWFALPLSQASLAPSEPFSHLIREHNCNP
ncbi:MAG TPA: PAS domain S-box protein [Ktedonobacteraceae bacterium]|nr:PAS domain S-box protein [Ktedonobacteraceae bacterium]